MGNEKVRMSKALKEKLKANNSFEHVKEFGNCTGVIEGLVDYNSVKPGETGYDPSKVGPEVNVRWKPSNLRYAYSLDDLDEI